ncbi:MAG: autotransporter outer membrane beta-barrel domain-containing protein [Endozoicomonas sp.]
MTKTRMLSRSLLAVAMATSVGVVQAKVVLEESFTLNSGARIEAGINDTSAIEIKSGASASTLTINGEVRVPSTSTKAVAGVQYLGSNTGFSLRQGSTGRIHVYGNTDGILISDNYPNTPSGAALTRFGFMELYGRVVAQDGVAIRLKDPADGTLSLGDSSILRGSKAIVAEELGGLTNQSLITSAGIVEGTSGIAIDFSAANNRLNLTVLGGIINGAIIGTTETGEEDTLVIKGGVINGNILDFEKVSSKTFDGPRGNTPLLASAPFFKGNIRRTDGGKTQLNVESDLKLGGDETQTLDVDYTQSADSELLIKLSDDAADEPQVVITGNAEFQDGATIKVAMDEEDFAAQAVAFKEYQAIRVEGDLSGESVLDVRSSILAEAEINRDGDKVIDIRVRPRPVEVVRSLTLEAGGGSSSGIAIETLLDDTLSILQQEKTNPGSVASDRLASARKIYETVSEIINPEELRKMARGSRINNADTTQQSNVILGSVTVNQISGRMESVRNYGRSFGDDLSGEGLWMQFLRADASQEDSTNDTGDKIFGFDSDVDGVSFGYERTYDNSAGDVLYGGALTMVSATTSKHESSDASKIKNYQVSFYSSWNNRGWYVDGIFNYGRSQHERQRYVNGILDTAIEANFDSSHYGLMLLSGKQMQYGSLEWQPIVGFNYTRVDSDGYSEEDPFQSGFAQAVDDQAYQKLELGLGVEISRSFQWRKGTIEPSARLMAWHDFKGEQVETTSRYLFGSQAYTVKGADPVRDSYQASLNLNYRYGNNMAFLLGYERNQKSGYESDNYFFRLKYDF